MTSFFGGELTFKCYFFVSRLGSWSVSTFPNTRDNTEQVGVYKLLTGMYFSTSSFTYITMSRCCLAWWLNGWKHNHLHLIQEHDGTIQVWVWINLWGILDSLQNTSSWWCFHDRISAHTRVIKAEWSWCCPRGTSGASSISPSLHSLCLFANVGPRTSLRCEFW